MLRLREATLVFGHRRVWSDLTLEVEPGEFVAVLGANGSGKTSLLRVILGQQQLSSGSVTFDGMPVSRGNRRIGYVPQQRLAEDGTPVRARDIIAFGLDGHRWGLPLPSRRRQRRIDSALAEVGAFDYGSVSVSTLSGGEQQRLRIGQALVADPDLVLCDEPLLSLDLDGQRAVIELIDEQRHRNIGVLFVTHDVNPILGIVDRVLYLAQGEYCLGTPDEVFRSDVLSDLCGSPIEVIHSRGRIIIIGGLDGSQTDLDGGHSHHVRSPQPRGGLL